MKTPYRTQQEARDLEIYTYYRQLAGQPDAMKTACETATMKKFRIHSRGTVWEICKRVEKRQQHG